MESIKKLFVLLLGIHLKNILLAVLKALKTILKLKYILNYFLVYIL